jgi:multicomponent Na+:H+ antiporter subunit F
VSGFLSAVALFLLANIALGLVRIFRGPAPADRMLAAQLFSSTGVAIMLVLAELTDQPAALDVALIFAVLAVLAALAFVRRLWKPQEED